MRPAATLPAPVAELAALQHGNLHTDDLLTLGVSDGLLRGLERRGVITEVLPSTWHCSGSPATWESEADAVLRWIGPEGALSHSSCARVLGVRGVPARARIEATVPYERHGHLTLELAARTRRGEQPVRLVRSRGFGAADRTVVRGLRLTTLPRLLVDAAALVSAPASLALLDQVVGERGAVMSEVHERITALLPGRRGLGAVREASAPGAGRVLRSWLERYAAQVFTNAGLVGFRCNVAIHDAGGRLVAVLDVYWEEARLPVELDGMRVHGPAAAARKDRRRDNRLRALQLPPLRYTYLDLLEETDRVLGEVTNALQAAGCGHLVGAPLADPVPLPPLPGARRR